MATIPVAFSPYKNEQGNFAQLSSKERLISSILRLIMTPKETDFEDPNFGVNIRSFLYELNNPNILDDIKFDIETAIEQYEFRFAHLVSIDVSYFNPSVFDKRFIAIDVYILTDTQEKIRILADATTQQLYVK